MIRKHLNLFFGISICIASTGCVTYSTVKDEARTPVRFETSAGAQTFYEAYIARNYTHTMSPRELWIGVSAQLPYHHREFRTDNVYFNDAIREADTNHDGVISDEEAKNFSRSIHPLPKDRVAVASK